MAIEHAVEDLLSRAEVDHGLGGGRRDHEGETLLTARYAVSPPPRPPRQPKNRIREALRPAYAEVLAVVVDLRGQGMTHLEICKALNRLGDRTRTGEPWRHPQQIIKLLRSFGGSG